MKFIALRLTQWTSIASLRLRLDLAHIGRKRNGPLAIAFASDAFANTARAMAAGGARTPSRPAGTALTIWSSEAVQLASVYLHGFAR